MLLLGLSISLVATATAPCTKVRRPCSRNHSQLALYRDRPLTGGYCPMNLPSFEELCKASDDQLFNKVIGNKQHQLYNLLPAQTVLASQNYHLRKRQHNRQPPKRTGHLTDSYFITRMLYANIKVQS